MRIYGLAGVARYTGDVRQVLRIAPLFCLCCLSTVAAQTTIYECTDADGGVSYSQLLCPPPAPAETEQPDPVEDVESEQAEAEQPDSPVVSPVEAECKKQVREQIDAIDAEIGQDYSPDKADEYKRRLLELTRKLRKC